MIGALLNRALLALVGVSLIAGAVQHFHIAEQRDALAGKIEEALN